MPQAAYGKGSLALTSLFSYMGLGLGLLGSSVALQFGLYVLIVQRDPEKYIKDEVQQPGTVRQAATIATALAAVMVLLPMAPELAQAFGVGPENPFL